MGWDGRVSKCVLNSVITLVVVACRAPTFALCGAPEERGDIHSGLRDRLEQLKCRASAGDKHAQIEFAQALEKKETPAIWIEAVEWYRRPARADSGWKYVYMPTTASALASGGVHSIQILPRREAPPKTILLLSRMYEECCGSHRDMIEQLACLRSPARGGDFNKIA